jgi:ABC-2 type transport system permease protein
VIRVLVQLNYWTTKNRIVTRIKRLRQFRYLVGLAAAMIYFGAFIRPWRFASSEISLGPTAILTPDLTLALESAAALLLMILAGLPWVWPGSRGALKLTQSEIAFLFPAPLTRKQIVDYHLLKSQTGTIFSAVLVTLFAARHVAPNIIQGFIAVWVLFSAVNLYILGVGITRANLVGHGLSGIRRMWVPAIGGVIVVGSLVWQVSSGVIHWPSEMELKDPVAFFLGITGAAPLRWLLIPFQALLHPVFTQGSLELTLSMAPIAMVIGAAYVWVVRSDHDYQEASAEYAQRRMTRSQRRRKTGEFKLGGKVKVRRAPYDLSAHSGIIATMVWRSLMAAWRVVEWPIIYRVTAATAASAWLYAAFIHRPEFIKPVMAASLMATILAGALLLMGSEMVRTDLRMDLLTIDAFKMLPVSGHAYIISVALASALIITVQQCLLLLLAFPLAALSWGGVHTLDLAVMGLAALLIVGPLNLLMSLVHNAALLTFPSWHQLGLTQARGLDNFGQTILSMVFRLLSFAVVLLPLALIAGAILFFTYDRFGSPAFLIAAVVLWIPVSLEIWLGVKLLGGLFERFDPSKELDQVSA